MHIDSSFRIPLVVFKPSFIIGDQDHRSVEPELSENVNTALRTVGRQARVDPAKHRSATRRLDKAELNPLTDTHGWPLSARLWRQRYHQAWCLVPHWRDTLVPNANSTNRTATVMTCVLPVVLMPQLAVKPY